MLRMAASCGTTLMAATPHGDSRRTWDKVDSLKGMCRDFNKELEREHVPMTLVLGMEVPLELDTVKQIEKGMALTINGSDYILVEIPFLQLPLYWKEVLFQLQLLGLRPIIAHPERQAQIQENPDLLAAAVDRGVFAQVTAGSIAGHFGTRARRTAETLLKRGAVHIIASDCHNADGPRNPDLREGYQAAAKLVGHDAAVQLVSETPWTIAYEETGSDMHLNVPRFGDKPTSR